MNYANLNKKIMLAKPMNRLVILSNTVDVLIGILAMFFSFLLLPAIISSCITGIILCIGFGMYNKLSKHLPAAITSEQAKAINIESKIFSKSNIILSVIDIITGLIAVTVIGIIVNNTILNFVTFITFVKGSKFISQAISGMVQLKKLRALYLTLGTISVSYISLRKNNYLKEGREFMKKLFSWIKANPKTLAAVSSILASIVLYIINYVNTLNLPEEVITYICTGLDGVGAIFAGLAGFEFAENKKVRDNAVKELKEEKAEEKAREKENAKYIAQAQAQLQASQDAQIEALAEQLKRKEQSVQENQNTNRTPTSF